MEIGHKIRHIRQIKNLSQENVASELGISQKSYSELENGKTSVSITKLEEIARVLKVNKDDILNYSSDKVFYYNNNTIENAYIENVNNLNKELIFTPAVSPFSGTLMLGQGTAVICYSSVLYRETLLWVIAIFTSAVSTSARIH